MKESSTPQHLEGNEVEKRKEWLEFEKIEQWHYEVIDELLEKNVDALMDNMYEHFLRFEETRKFFPSKEILERAKNAQKQYFLKLAKGSYDTRYVDDRLRVGHTHHRIELDPKWYIGAYNRAVSWLLPLLMNRMDGKDGVLPIAKEADTQAARTEASLSLLKLIFFDMGLAIESYIGAKEFALLKQRDAIQELETEKRVTKSILEGAPIGIVSLDEKFHCVECNQEFAKLLSVDSTDQILSKNLFELAPLLPKNQFVSIEQTGIPGQFSAQALNFTQDKNAQISYWDWAVWPVKNSDGAVSGFVAMFSNATDRVQLQQQREDFVATLTHDLKTPVSATNRTVKLLLDGDYGPLDPDQHEILNTVLQSNTALYSLVMTLLDVYRFDSGVKEMDMRVCNLSATVTQLVTEIMPLARERQVNLRAVLPVEAVILTCDTDEIRRVVQNLVDNSLKFTAPGGAVTVSLSQDGSATTLSVADTGKGIAEENMSKLFQRFWQAGSSGRYYASTGLGLYLARKIVEAHGGRISCQSTIGKGSTFQFFLPNQPAVTNTAS